MRFDLLPKMNGVYHDINVNKFNDKTDCFELQEKLARLEVLVEDENVTFTLYKYLTTTAFQTITTSACHFDCARVGKRSFSIYHNDFTLLLTFPSENDLTTLFHRISQGASKAISNKNIFDQRTDKWSAVQYFQFYSFLSQQQNMMQDFVRTATYQRSVLNNTEDFKNQVVLDVGAGSGILSFFAIQGGAKKVYAVEASNMAEHCEALVMSNKLAGKIIVLGTKIEEAEIPELVDVIISEPMGYMLFNERMLESFVHARKFLRPGGKMYPSVANLYIAPFSDDMLYMEQYSKANFWYQQNFHGVDLSPLREAAVKEYFRQPVVDTWDVQILLASPCKHVVDFLTIKESDLYLIDVPLHFTAIQSGMIHGYAFWFDVGFLGSQNEVWLSTAPTELLTHWYQVRCLFLSPVFVTAGQQIEGRLTMRANSRQSYDVDIEIQLNGMTRPVCNTLDLKNPCFRYTGAPTQPPPGANKCPTDTFWNNILQNQQAHKTQMLCGQTSTLGHGSTMDMGVADALLSNNLFSVPSTNTQHYYVQSPPSTMQNCFPTAAPAGFAAVVNSQFLVGDYSNTSTVGAANSGPMVTSRITGGPSTFGTC